MKILVVGYGSIGKRHILNLKQIGKIDVIVLTKRKRDNFLKKNCYKIFSTLDECLKEKPKAAIICNETNLHLKVATKLVKNDIHVFIEKPISNSLVGINDLKKNIQKKKIITHVGCVLRFHPIIKTTKKLLENNIIGKIKFVHSENGSYLPDWHPKENYRKSYASKDMMGGGVVLTCIHELDYLIWMLGRIDSVVSKNAKISGLGIQADDISVSILKFNSNIIGELHLDFFQRPKTRFCKIIGDKGTLQIDFEKNQLKLYKIKNKKFQTVEDVKGYNKNEMYVDEMRYFLKCVKGKEKSFNDINFGEKVLKTALSINESSKKKKEIIIK